MLPEGEKKEAVRKKINQINKAEESSGGLHDEFALVATGDILLEEINDEGESIGVLAEQKNLVVQGSEEILLRAISGDPARALYKNRKPVSSSVYHTSLRNIVEVLDGDNTLIVNPNELWKEVDDSDFTVEYSYYPNILFVKEEASTVPGKKAFSIHSESTPDTAPISAELYSTFTNLFIGLGDGKNYAVDLDDSRLSYAGAFTDEDGKATTELDAAISFSEKVSNFEISYEAKKDSGKIEILINDSSKKIIDTADASLLEGTEIRTEVFSGLDHTAISAVKIKSTEATPVKVTGIKWDALSVERNSLIREFGNHTKNFDTPAMYNTTAVAPYTVNLEHSPLEKNTVKVSYNGIPFEEVSSAEELTESKFFVDHLTGTVQFNRALTNIMIQYHITGQLVENKNVAQMESVEVAISVVDETPVGSINGINTIFQLENTDISSATVKVQGVSLEDGTDYNLDTDTGVITFITAPQSLDTVLVSYVFFLSVNRLELPFSIDDVKEVKLLDQSGEELTKSEDMNDIASSGIYVIDRTDKKAIFISKLTLSSQQLESVKAFYFSNELPGVETNYHRAVILKPKK